MQTGDEDGKQKLVTNRAYLVSFVALIFLGGMHVGFSIGSANQLATLFNVKYGWKPGYDQDIHQSFIGSSVVVGLCIGSMAGGKVINMGRRKTILIFDMVGICGVLCTLI